VLVSHLTVLRISLGEEDGGTMFMMAIIGWIVGAIIVYLRRSPLQALIAKAA